MTDTVERLHTIRAHLRTGALGQREVWEEWLTEAVAEIERESECWESAQRWHEKYKEAQAGLERLQEELADVRADAVLLRSEIARLKEQVETCRELRKYDRIEIERMRILLESRT
jgi:uncharacterized coiled-coil DUF342 family protein